MKAKHYVTIEIGMRMGVPTARPAQRKVLARAIAVRDRLLACSNASGDVSNMRDALDALESLASTLERARASAHNRR